jgi:hypothetical protein
MMKTPKQLAANRASARKSTGPRTAAGKRRASRNAVTHGLFSREILVPGEDAAVLARFRRRMMARLDPADDLERLLADRIVVAAWRMRRAGGYLGQILEYEWAHAQANRQSHAWLYENSPALSTGELVNKLFRNDVLSKLSRYEGRIERGLYRALHELQRMQARRRGELVPSPIAVDVNVNGVGEEG